MTQTVKLTDDTPVCFVFMGKQSDFRKLNGIPELMERYIQRAGQDASSAQPAPGKNEKRYVYGIRGIAQLFNCSMPTANRIKASGKIDGAITQIGRKIIVDADLALELAGRKTGGRR